ncbi:hypothetical protein SLA2020_136880 [Shorea laevis]
MLHISRIGGEYSTLNRCQKPVSRVSLGNFSVVVIELVEVEELAENAAVNWWVIWVVNRLPGINFNIDY